MLQLAQHWQDASIGDCMTVCGRGSVIEARKGVTMRGREGGGVEKNL